ncbi:DUF551 domain-containing protein [Enterobacter asburiae]
MSTITKELAKLFRKITNSEIDAEGNAHVVLSPADSLLINNARIALASLEAEAVAFVMADDLKDSSIISTPAYRDLGEAMERTVGDVVALYAAPPAPVSVPDEMEMDDDFDSAFEHGKAVGWNACRAAMLQGAEQQQNEPQNIPVNIPSTQFKPVADLYGISVPGGRATTYSTDAAEASDCRVMGWDVQEYVKLERYQEALSGNSPVIPDWQAKAEKMAEIHGSSFVLFRNGESPQCADPTKVIISFTDKGLGHGSAAPQQEDQ